MGLSGGIIGFWSIWDEGTEALLRGQHEQAALTTDRMAGCSCQRHAHAFVFGAEAWLAPRDSHNTPNEVCTSFTTLSQWGSGSRARAQLINHLFNQSELIEQARVGRARLGLGLCN